MLMDLTTGYSSVSVASICCSSGVDIFSVVQGQWWDTLGYPISVNPHQDIDTSSKKFIQKENNNYRINMML